MFEPMPYLEWIEGRPEAATYDLGSSAVRGRESPAVDAVVPSPLADRDHPGPEAPSLRESLAAEYGVAPERVLVTGGATQANMLAAAAVLGLESEDGHPEGDPDLGSEEPTPRVLVEKPGYDPLVYTPSALGATVDRFRRPPEDDYALQPDRVAAAALAETVLATVTNRHNPSGRLADRDRLAAVADAATEAGCRLLVDEVYAPYVDGDGPPAGGDEGTAFGGPTAAGLPNTVVTGSLTKFHGLEELRVGWLVGPERVVERARAAATHTGTLAGPSRALARRFFSHRDELVADSRRHLRTGAERLRSFVAGRDDLTATHADPGCSFAFVEHDGHDGDAVAEAAWDAGVLVIPGRFFGLSEGVRLSAGGDPEEVAVGLDRFGQVLDGLG
ncbi:MAG: pyridoxal phosphate-dependent aminotransferase [Halolamina sp.]